MIRKIIFLLMIFCFVIFGSGDVKAFADWQYNQDGSIDLKSVCKRIKYGSIKYRKCRSKAQKTFKTICKKRKSKKHCDALNRYSIVD